VAGPAARLLRWFRAAARPFPWREPFPRDPYRTLVAEVMLQQTQAARVAPFYQRFLAAFPTLEALAAAPQEEVVRHFSGLGYYRRARLLHATCRTLLRRGGWPPPGELQSLEGLGSYTAAALAAFCFGGSEPPLDGNLLRIAARLLAHEAPLRAASLRRDAAALGRALYLEAGTPEVFEALMDLGAQVCRPVSPRCPDCPLKGSCRAFQLGEPQRFPTVPATRPVTSLLWVAVWIRSRSGAVLLQRRPPGELLAGLWLPPLRPVLPPAADPCAVARELARSLGFAGSLQALPAVRHSITYRRLTVVPFALGAEAPRVAEEREDQRWECPDTPGVPTSSLLSKLAAAAGQGASGGPAATTTPGDPP